MPGILDSDGLEASAGLEPIAIVGMGKHRFQSFPFQEHITQVLPNSQLTP